MKQQFNLKQSLCAVAVSSVFFTCAPALADNEEIITVQGSRIYAQGEQALSPIENSNVDFSDTLRKEAGLSINRNGPTSSIVQYRGLFGDRLKVSIDGAPIAGAGPNAMDSPLSHVFAEAGTKAVFYKGIAPVSAGTETLAGAIKIEQTTSANFYETPAIHGLVSATASSPGNVQQLNGSATYGQQNAYVVIGGLHQKANDMEDGDGQAIPNYQYQRNGGKLRAGYKWNNHELHANYQILSTDDAGTPSLGMDINYIDANWYRLTYKFNRDQDFGLNINVFGNQNDHGMDNVSLRNTMPMMARLNTVDSDLVGAKASAYILTRIGKFSWGLTSTASEHNSEITNPQMHSLRITNFNNIQRDVTSVFGEVELSHQNWHFLVGTRYTETESNADDVASSVAMMNPNVASLVSEFNSASRDIGHNFVDVSLHANYHVTDSLNLSLALAQKNRAPSYTELYTWLPLTISAGLADGFTYIGNLNLREESAQQIDLGFEFNNSRLYLSPRLFYQSFDDYIVGVPAMNPPAMMIAMMMGNPAPLQWQNVDAKLYGADLEAGWQVASNFSLKMTASMVRGERTDINDDLFRISPDNLTTTATWYTCDWKLIVESQLFASQKRVSALQIEQPSAGYGIVNVAASYQVLKDLTVSLSLYNALDKAYQPHLSGLNRDNSEIQPVGERIFAPGRQAALSLMYQF